MKSLPVVVSLPIADRRAAFDFYRNAFDFEAVGETAEDGVPEPLQFQLNDGARLMLIPSGGFNWITGDHDVAAPGCSECVVVIATETDSEVDELVLRAQGAGASIVTAPGPQPWGYAGSIADLDGHLWMIRSQASRS